MGGVITSRREQRKAAAEDERWRLEIEAKRRDRQLEYKTELFGKFLSTAEGIERTEGGWGKAITHEGLMAKKDVIDQMRDWGEEIGLLAPELHRHAGVTAAKIQGMYVKKLLAHSETALNDARIEIQCAEEDVAFWIRRTREAVRAYMNHEPVVWPEEAIDEHKRAQRESVRFLREAVIDDHPSLRQSSNESD